MKIKVSNMNNLNSSLLSSTALDSEIKIVDSAQERLDENFLSVEEPR